jgi:hypothetical protein
MKNLLLLSLAAMGCCLLAAAPRAFPEASNGEARMVIGGDCVNLGNATSVCSDSCPGNMTGKTTGVAPGTGSGSYHTNSIKCYCDSTASTDSTAGTCTTGG